MASDFDSGLLPRTYFKAPRVPFDFRALTIAILGYLTFWAGGLVLNLVFDKQDVTGSFLDWFASLFEGVPFIGRAVGEVFEKVFHIDLGEGETYTFWHKLVGGLWFVVVWSFFGQAVHRITSLRIARDEGLTIGEALRFGATNGLSVVRAPLIIIAVMGAFYLCNALAGVLMSIPVLGGVLAIVLVPLTVVSTILILLVGLGGIFGLPLIGASAAWEVNGSLDAISRAFSYVFARPLQYFWNFLLIFLFTGVVLLVGNWFIFTQMNSIALGSWSDVQEVMVAAPKHAIAKDSDWDKLSDDAKRLDTTLQEKSGFTGRNYAPGRADPGIWVPPASADAQPTRKKSGPYARSFETVIHAPWPYMLNALVLWVITNLVWLGVFGYAVYWLIGASSSVYADLRADVDGTGEDEIYLEDDEETFESLAEGGPTSEAGTIAAEVAAAEAIAGGAAIAEGTDVPDSDDAKPDGSDEGADEKSGPDA